MKIVTSLKNLTFLKSDLTNLSSLPRVKPRIISFISMAEVAEDLEAPQVAERRIGFGVGTGAYFVTSDYENRGLDHDPKSEGANITVWDKEKAVSLKNLFPLLADTHERVIAMIPDELGAKFISDTRAAQKLGRELLEAFEMFKELKKRLKALTRQGVSEIIVPETIHNRRLCGGSFNLMRVVDCSPFSDEPLV